MPAVFEARTRRWLLRLRILGVPGGCTLDPHSLEYLYLIQQRKRLSLSASVGRLRPANLLLLPAILVVVLVKTIDLWTTNQVVRSIINEYDLQQRLDSAKDRPS